MRRVLPFVFVAGALVLGMFAGGYVTTSAYNLPQYSPRRLVEAIRDGQVSLGTDSDSLPLIKPRAIHIRTNNQGVVLLTRVYQDRHHIVVLTLEDGRMSELTLWNYNRATPEVYLHSR